MKRVALFSILFGIASAGAEAGGLLDLFPPEAMLDPVSLQLEMSEPQPYKAKSAPGTMLRQIEFTFTSFEWAGEPWRHKAVAILPEEPAEAYRGCAAILSGGNDTFRGMAEAAALMGIPAILVTSANPGPHYGVEHENELMTYGQDRFAETGDPNWAPYAWLGKIIVRAATAAQAIPGIDAKRFVVSGCSKRAAAAWIATAADDRIVGAFPTCWNSGNIAAQLQLKAERWGMDYQPKLEKKTEGPARVITREQIERAGSEQGRESLAYSDPYAFNRLLSGKKVLYASGTNDSWFHVASNTVFLPFMPQGARIMLVPNAAHTPATQWHAAAWPMWLAHCFAGRDIPRIGVIASRDGENLTINASVEGVTRIRGVRVWSATDDSGAYLDADWKSVELDEVSGRLYSGSIHAPAGAYTGYFVQVEDDDSQSVPGVITTGFMESIGADAGGAN